MDPRARFSATVEDYRRFRPDYPSAFFDAWERSAGLSPGARVLDVGCGTGIVSRQLAARGHAVTGLDPNPAMLAAARAEADDIAYIEGDVESLSVDARYDAIVGGQCFHWFDMDRALVAMRAAVRPEGPILAFWNLRDRRDPLMAGYEALLLQHCPEYENVGAEPRARAVAKHPALGPAKEIECAHHQVLDHAGFRGRVWSSSYVRHSVRDAGRFDDALDALFSEHQQDGTVRFVYRCWGLSFG